MSTRIIVSFPEHLNGTDRHDMAISLEPQQPLGHAEVIDGLRDAEQRRYHDHSARATLEERSRPFVHKCLTANRKAEQR